MNPSQFPAHPDDALPPVAHSGEAHSHEPHPPGSPLPRGTRPDAETPRRIYLVKQVLVLRATYQIRLLALKAAAQGKQLVLQVPRGCRFDRPLADLAAAMPGVIQREDRA
jgi:hypothetical protein